MKELKTIKDVIFKLNENEVYEKNYKTYGELVDDLVSIGYLDKVHAFHDDILGLKDNLTEEFLNSKINNRNNSYYEEETGNIINEANIVISLAERELSDDNKEEIEEDLERMGINPDSADFN